MYMMLSPVQSDSEGQALLSYLKHGLAKQGLAIESLIAQGAAGQTSASTDG